MACRQKQEGPTEWVPAKSKTEQQIFAFQLIEQKAEGQDSRIPLVSENTDSAETYYYH
jgi:hypothetical protein